MQWVLSLKTLAALLFAGFICAYIVAAYLYAAVIGEPSTFSLPFIFIYEALGLSVVIAVLWRVLFNEQRAQKRRFFPRLIIFAVLLMLALVVCLLIFFPFHTNWAKLWLLVAGAVVGVVILLSIVAELYLRQTGRRYTELLREYQAKR